jgi:hypothetical protein
MDEIMLTRLKTMLAEASTRIARAESQLSQAASHSREAAGHSLMTQYTLNDFAERSLQLRGRMAARSLPRGKRIKDLSEVEFRVYSQWGEDGIIEWLAAHIPVPNTRFIEFGVETFREANCRFLMQNRNWKGLVIDGSEANMASLRAQPYFWMYDLTAKGAFVTAENIDTLITEAGFAGPLGILSVDVDGNDYWIWRAIQSVQPAIVICEVNSIFGDKRAVTIPYNPSFTRFSAHFSGLYFGASIGALHHLASSKGYSFVGTSASGINAFFVRDDLAAFVLDLIEEPRAFPSRHRDSRDRDGNLTFAGGFERFALIADMPVVDVQTRQTVRLGDMKQPYSDAWQA